MINIFCSNQKQKNQKDQNVSEWNHGSNTGTTKKHVLAYFQKFGWLTNSSIIFKWMLYHTIDHTIIFIYWLLFTFILLTLITIQYALITLTLLRYTFFILQITSSLLRNENNRINDAWGGFFWKSIWKLKISFTEIFHGSLRKQFNWNLMLRHTEINAKLVFHEILWNKNFTVYPSLKSCKNKLI